MNLFEYAARNQLRFPSAKGNLTVEDLFDVPLTSKNGFDLDMIARGINTQLRAATEESFVTTNRNTGETRLTNALEIVKFVIADKQQQAAEAATRAERVATKRRILDIIEQKKDEELSTASIEELEAKLATL